MRTRPSTRTLPKKLFLHCALNQTRAGHTIGACWSMDDAAKATQVFQVLFHEGGADKATQEQIKQARSVLAHVEGELDARERMLQRNHRQLRKSLQQQELVDRFRQAAEWATAQQSVPSPETVRGRAKRARLAASSKHVGADNAQGTAKEARCDTDSGTGTDDTDDSDDTSSEDTRKQWFVDEMMEHSVLTVRFSKTLRHEVKAYSHLFSVFKLKIGFVVDECSHEWGPDGCASGITDIGSNIRRSEESMKEGLKWYKPAPPDGAREALDDVVDELFGEEDEYEDHIREHLDTYASYIDDDRAHSDNDSIWGTLKMTLAVPTSLVSGYLRLTSA
jgi:hypothetical protein